MLRHAWAGFCRHFPDRGALWRAGGIGGDRRASGCRLGLLRRGAVGLTILFQLVPWLYLVLKIAGGAYLVWIGIQFLKAGKAPEAAIAQVREPLAARAAARKGLLIGLTNPKAMVYFGSIFTLFLKPGSPLWLDGAAIGIVTFDVVVWYGFVSLVFSRDMVRHAYQRMGHWIERAAGVVMAGFGLKLLLARD